MKSTTILLIVLGTFALTNPATFAAEQTSPYTGPWPGWHAHWPGFWWICPLMMLFMFFAVVLFVLRRNRGYRGATPESALDILNKRYARGEIDKEEYDEKKTTIISTDK